MRFLSGLLACFLLISTLAAAQTSPAGTIPPNTIAAGGDGTYAADPDTALLQFNISAQESTSRAAYDRASKAAEQIRGILRSNAIDPKTAQFGFFSLQPVYDYKTAQRKLIGYRVTADVTVKLKDFPKIPPILEQLANMDVTADQNLSYTLEDTEAAKIHAVEDAYRKAREVAAAVARASGRTLGGLSYASVDVNEPGPVRPLMAMAAARVAGGATPAPTAEFSPQKITVSAHVNAIFALK